MNQPPMFHKVIIPRPWVSSVNTNVAATFARVRQEQALESIRQFSGGGYVENRTRRT